jgi:hypothetical protein
MGLWLETFFGKQQTESKGGASLELGAISFQRRPHAPYPKPKFVKKVTGWTRTFFYVKNIVPAHQAAFLPFMTSRFVAQRDRLTSHAGPADISESRRLQAKIAILCRRGLRFHTLVGSWLGERIIPLGPRHRLLSTYSGRSDDYLRASDKPWTKVKFVAWMKRLVQDRVTDIDVGGLPPFWKGNKHYDVSH